MISVVENDDTDDSDDNDDGDGWYILSTELLNQVYY